MSVETGAKSAIPLRCAPNSQPFRNCSSDKSGSFAEAEAYHSFYRKLAQRHFNPRAPEGCNTPVYFSLCSMRCFNPRAPCGARRAVPDRQVGGPMFQPTRPVRGATLLTVCPGLLSGRFNPRAPRGARPTEPSRAGAPAMFQPTRPARGATPKATAGHRRRRSFNPRAPRGARPKFLGNHMDGIVFQPTRPAKGATCEALPCRLGVPVSTHAPREGRDCHFMHNSESNCMIYAIFQAASEPSQQPSTQNDSIHARTSRVDPHSLGFAH